MRAIAKTGEGIFMRLAIVDDDAQQRSLLEEYVKKYFKEQGKVCDVVCFSSGVDFASDYAAPFDIILLDIDMPHMNGIEAAKKIRQVDEHAVIIFITRMAQYAIQGYEVDALDFIVKPVTYYNFRMRMDKAMRHIRRNAGRSITLTTRDGMRVVPLADIEYVEVSKHDLSYHIYGDPEPFVVYGSLKAFEDEVAGGPFVRISASCVVNMNQVRLVKGPSLLMKGGDTLYFSRSRRREAIATITNFLGGSI